MVQMEPLQPQLPSKFEFLEYLKFESLEHKNEYWPTVLSEYGYAPTLAGLESLLDEPYVNTYTDDRYSDCITSIYSEGALTEINNTNIGILGHIYFCFESTLDELKLLAEYGYEPTFADLDTSPDFLQWFEKFQSEELRKSAEYFEEYFNDDWRSGQEIHKVVITQRLYQTSPNSTQA